MGQGALSKPVVQRWLSLNSSTSDTRKDNDAHGDSGNGPSNRERSQTVKGEKGREVVHSHSAPPVSARLCTTAVRRVSRQRSNHNRNRSSLRLPTPSLPRRRGTNKDKGTGDAVGCRADPTSTTSLPAPSFAPGALPLPRIQTAVQAMRRPPSSSRAGLRVVPQGEKESCMALALAFILGPVVVLAATLPCACGRDGGRSTRVGICSRIGRGWKCGVASRSVNSGDRSCHRRAVLCLVKGNCRVSASGSGTLRGAAGSIHP